MHCQVQYLLGVFLYTIDMTISLFRPCSYSVAFYDLVHEPFFTPCVIL